MYRYFLLAAVIALAGCRPHIKPVSPGMFTGQARPSFLVATPTLVPTLSPTAQPTPRPGYTVKPGDTLWKISPALVGDHFCWPILYRQNRDQLLYGPDWLDVGQALAVGNHTAVDDANARQEAYNRPMFYSHGKKSE